MVNKRWKKQKKYQDEIKSDPTEIKRIKYKTNALKKVYYIISKCFIKYTVISFSDDYFSMISEAKYKTNYGEKNQNIHN